jgi:hypothetical protein
MLSLGQKSGAVIGMCTGAVGQKPNGAGGAVVRAQLEQEYSGIRTTGLLASQYYAMASMRQCLCTLLRRRLQQTFREATAQ